MDFNFYIILKKISKYYIKCKQILIYEVYYIRKLIKLIFKQKYKLLKEKITKML